MDRQLDPAHRRRLLVRRGALVAAVAISGSWLYVTLPGWLEPSVSRARVRIERVERGRVEAAFEASGVVVPAAELAMSSPLDTRVLRVVKRPGESVSRGEPIVELDVSEARLEAERLERRLEQQQNERSQLDLALERELVDLDGSIEIQRMELEILRYRAEQQERLYREGLIADGLRREAAIAARKGEVELSKLESARHNATRTTATRLATLDLDSRVTAADLEQARQRLERASARAERDGVVTWVLDEPGASVRRGETVARIADLGSFRVEATVSDIHATRLLTGGVAHVSVGNDWIEGHVAEVEPAIEKGIARFTVGLERADHPALRSNLRVDVWVVTGARDDVLRLARGPFMQGGGLEQVFVLDGPHAVRTEARIGLVGREHLEVLDGLALGDEVIVSDMRERLHLDKLSIR